MRLWSDYRKQSLMDTGICFVAREEIVPRLFYCYRGAVGAVNRFAIRFPAQAGPA
jgi:hypothetical protein